MSMASSCVVPHLKILRRVGFIGLQPPRPNAPGASPRARRLHNFYCWFTLVGTSFHVLQHLICAYQGRHDVAGLSRTLYEMFSFCTCVSKQVAIRVHQRRVDLLLAALDDPLYNQPGERFARMMRETAKGAKMIMRTFYSCGVCTVTLWLTFPVVHRLKGNYVEFPFWTFVDYTEPKMFALVALHSAYMTALLSMGNTTTDVFIGSLLYQCTTQLRILRINFESLTERARKLSEELNESYETTLRKLLVECIQHFQKIADMTEEILAVFGEAILVLFGVGAWMMCTAAYTLISVSNLAYCSCLRNALMIDDFARSRHHAKLFSTAREGKYF
uniref:Olfactory receptor n=1 Tax=Glyphodes pyloalis TaxID=1242752 RepID=A0A6M3GWM3_GLYPY|nr:olfactory receptor [Glyphodes pyloalis]